MYTWLEKIGDNLNDHSWYIFFYLTQVAYFDYSSTNDWISYIARKKALHLENIRKKIGGFCFSLIHLPHSIKKYRKSHLFEKKFTCTYFQIINTFYNLLFIQKITVTTTISLRNGEFHSGAMNSPRTETICIMHNGNFTITTLKAWFF